MAMESLIHKIFVRQWQRKLVAFIAAAIVWFSVNVTIISTKTIPGVPIRITNLPPDKTIIGLQPNGFLFKRTSLTLSGTKSVIDQLEPGDIEVLLDVSNQPNESVAQITKKNLISLNPNINLGNHITEISYPSTVLKMSPLLTEKIPINIVSPEGSAPEGYKFLDIWPTRLTQTVTGPEELVLALQHDGVDLAFNLDEITKEQLDALKGNGQYDDEVGFLVPDQWKKVLLSSLNRTPIAINDPDAKALHINFLREQMIPIKSNIPLHVFYPLKNLATINPETYALAPSPYIQIKYTVPVLTLPLFASNVSKIFLDIVKDNIELEIVTAPTVERENLEWGIGFIDDGHLESSYVAFVLSNTPGQYDHQLAKRLELEQHYRKRFRTYMQQMKLYLLPKYPLNLESRLTNDQVKIHVPNASLVGLEHAN
jgi:hypothetical protein